MCLELYKSEFIRKNPFQRDAYLPRDEFQSTNQLCYKLVFMSITNTRNKDA